MTIDISWDRAFKEARERELKAQKEKIKEAFEVGFCYGKGEQIERDFPNVGWRYNKEADYYFNIWDKEK